MIFNKINVNALDRIIIHESDANKFNEVNKILNDNPALNKIIMDLDTPFGEKGIITYIPNTKNSLQVDFFFNFQNRNRMELSEIDGEGKINFRVSLDAHLNLIDLKRFVGIARLSDEYISELAKRTVILLVDFMKYAQYMNYTKQNNPIVIKRAVIKKSTQNSTEKSVKDTRSTVSVSKPKKVYDYEGAEREGDKRQYERQAESWEVTGHWRHYKKTDKRVFVKGYKKGEGTKKGKDYTV